MNALHVDAALHAAAAKAETTIKEMKADLKADFSKPPPLFRGLDSKGDLPLSEKSLVEKSSETEVRLRILDISQSMDLPKEKPEEQLHHELSGEPVVEMGAATQSAGFIHEGPKKMKEQEFWKRYFVTVRNIKQEILEVDPQQFEASIQSGSEAESVEADSPKKDPSEEEAYKNAFTVVAVPPSILLRRLASAVEAGRPHKTMKELAQGPRSFDKVHPSNTGEWTGLASGFAMMRKLSKEKNPNKASGNYSAVLRSLFETDTQHEEKDVSVPSCVARRPMLPEEIHGAPPESFVAQLAEIMGGMKSEQKMAEFWMEVIKELRLRWSAGQPIPRMPVDDNPDLRYCLLHQQIQLINCCMARRKRRALHLATLHNGESRNPQVMDVSRIPPGNAGAVSADDRNTSLYVRQKNGDLLLRLGADHPAADLRMLETGELIYSPVTQEGPVLTEDLMQETEELVLRTGSMGAGCSHLLSDMQAFKAANPGCILEDFVRWYSPNDWRESLGSDILSPLAEEGNSVDKKSSPRGHLSARMQCEGNLWQELWSSARPVPAVKQAPLFDEELAGESTLDALEDAAPSDLFQQLFTSALSAGFAVVEGSAAAKRDPLKSCLKQCTEYIISTSGREMSAEKLEHLCEVYEVMEATVHVPPQEVQESRHLVNSKPEAPNCASLELTRQSAGELECEKVPEKLTKRRSAPDIFQNVKGDSVFSRLMEVKVNFFEKRNHRQPYVEDKKPSLGENDWTII